MFKRIISTLIVVLLSISMYSLPSSAESNDILSQEEVNRLLGVETRQAASDEQADLFFEQLPDLLTLNDDELSNRLEELNLDEIVELSEEPPQEEHNGTSSTFLDSNGNSLNARMLVPTGESFHADFINKMVTSSFFNVDLYFYNLCRNRITQFAGYVNYSFERAIGNWMTFPAPYISVGNIPVGPMKIHSYSYTHYNCNALYTGDFVVVYQGTAYPMKTLTEHK